MRCLYSFWFYCLCLFFANSTTVFGQADSTLTYNVTDLDVQIKTDGRLIKANKVVMTVEVVFPENWKLDVRSGYGSLTEEGMDTFAMSLSYRSHDGTRLVQRLKAARKPRPKGFYYEPIVFAQTIAIDTTQLPIFIDASLKWAVLRQDEKQRSTGLTCCLLEIADKRRKVKRIHAGWNCGHRKQLFLEDIAF